ncbi:uncharacterized protein N7482_002548 [Penicillium canariense]|uniref:Non-structural maintenance of chromosomes element 4 n=1 Tax=Penicillium canariense TaxID=189055 RepID=A0A9W9IJ76_9EURO|nr:uncharacterized protein N7482_002548 [Penicillium canariense]KAJ5176671.1 hypothetical protein N7482_002548 [Penicillium canariense]
MARIAQSQLDEPNAHSSNPPSSPSSSSDKENRRNSVTKRSTAQMARSSQSTKRRRLTGRASNIQSHVESSQRNDRRFYDPDQPEVERRRLRKSLRDLTTDLHDSRAEYMQSGNDGIYRTVERANTLFAKVKQTSDATIDSRLLVTAADLSHKKTAQLALGDSSAGIDVDEFVSKCISYMRRGPDLADSSTQRLQRPRRSQRDPNESDEGDPGDAMNWDWLGRTACLLHNSRPTVSGFLLGPLSVQKRTRQLTQRAGRERFDAREAIQPQELQQEDLGQQENSNLTLMCSKINSLLRKTMDDHQDKVNEILNAETDPSEERIQEVMDEYHLDVDGKLSFFHFCINPLSFGQSVENLFYISFLVRDGVVGISMDGRGIPTLYPTEPYAPHIAQANKIQKHQAIFSLDFETWADLVNVFDIKKSIIAHREETQEESGQTWYG